VYAQLRRIVDPDFGADIVECGFVKQMSVNAGTGAVSFTLELTTPVRCATHACLPRAGLPSALSPAPVLPAYLN
jgi:metal-sulfur cluster biosynthetic enzyme